MTDAHTRNIAAEKIVFPLIDMVMARMTRGLDCADLEGANADDIHVLQNLEIFFRDRRKTAPEFLHLIAKDARADSTNFAGSRRCRAPRGCT